MEGVQLMNKLLHTSIELPIHGSIAIVSMVTKFIYMIYWFRYACLFRPCAERMEECPALCMVLHTSFQKYSFLFELAITMIWGHPP